MKQLLLLSTLFFFFSAGLSAQKYFTREGNISFFSEAPLEKIEAHNRTATAVLDTESGRMEFAALIKAFQFEKALMQEHFNENYMESSTYPKASFKGQIADPGQVNWKKDGTYPVVVKGELTIHGQTRSVEAPGKITVRGNALSAVSSFSVAVADYGIEIPAVVRDNIAKEVRIDVNVDLQPLKS